MYETQISLRYLLATNRIYTNFIRDSFVLLVAKKIFIQAK